MKTSSAKAKGRRLQDALKKTILENFPSLEEDDVKCAIMGETGKDLHLSPAAKKVFPFSVECKNQEKISIWTCLEQAEKNTDPGTSPLLVFKRNRSKTYVALELEEFVKLLTRK